MTKIIAFIDGSIYSQSVCDHAAWAARRTGASVEMLHVLGRREMSSVPEIFSFGLASDARDALLSELAAFDEQKRGLGERRGAAILEQAAARVREAGVEEVSTRLLHGDLVEAAQAAEPTADLFVMGKRGEAADFARLHLGSNLERVARAVRKPVLAASRAFTGIERVLVAFDASRSVMQAIDEMATSRLFRGLDNRVLMVGPETPDLRRQLEGAAARVRATEARIVPGQPDVVIPAEVEAKQIQMLVMGAYGHSRIRALIIGGTSSEMIRSCRIPVMLFR
jgi:nucleotide-binding universal stress UspA family protein